MNPDLRRLKRALVRAGVGGPVSMQLLPGGGNNRVYRLDTERGPLLGKIYFRHPGDRRDRLAAEAGFLEFARDQGIGCVPRLLAGAPAERTALLEFIPGRILKARELTWSRVAEAVAFFAALNRDRSSGRARRLPAASEACFTVEAHLACVERRLERLRSLKGGTAAGREAARFVRTGLLPAWKRVARGMRPCSRAPLRRSARCLSPSDFGFHNALLKPDGRLCFIDFEYAGWDDPAKTACDFFCQPAVPVNPGHLSRFVEGISDALDHPDRLLERVRMLLPVYRLKWCCILLNEFLPVPGARRTFARGGADPEARKEAQLRKAQAALRGMDL